MSVAIVILALIAACTGGTPAPSGTGTPASAPASVAATEVASEAASASAPEPSSLAASASASEETSGAASDDASGPPTELRDPTEAALEAAGGEAIGGSVSVMGVLGGEELTDFETVFAPFEEATGITVDYESSRDLQAVLQTRVDGGNPPDVVITPTIGQMFAFADEGKLVDLNEVLDAATIEQNYDEGLVAIGSRDDQMFGLFNTVNLGNLIWYNPKTYTGPTEPETWEELQAWTTETAAGGTTPWCIGLASGAASGWPGAEFITAVLLRQAGPDFHDQWWQGEVAWTSTEVRQAFETYGEIATDPKMVYGGPSAVLATAFENGADAIFTDPPTCFLHEQATFMGGIILENYPDLKPIDDINFFGMPNFTAEHDNLQQISGEIVSMFNDTPQSQALVRYLATPEAGSLIAATGRWLAPNKGVPAESYTDPFIQRASEILAGAGRVSYLGSDLLPQAVGEGFWKATLDYVQDPGSLDAVLAELERLRGESYP
ncbi:MAG: ABC transporter substrate-binding protein [Candidatus Limnocylindrales bacterium]